MKVNNLINSTSFYLSNKARELIDGKTTLADIRTEMNESLVVPSSRFETTNDLLKSYKKIYFADLDDTRAQQLAEAFLGGVDQAKKDGRYFGRHREEIQEVFEGKRDVAAESLKGFFKRHGFEVKSEAEFAKSHMGNRRLNDFLLDYFDPAKALRNQPEKINGEMVKKPPMGIRNI